MILIRFGVLERLECSVQSSIDTEINTFTSHHSMIHRKVIWVGLRIFQSNLKLFRSNIQTQPSIKSHLWSKICNCQGMKLLNHAAPQCTS